LDEAGSTPGLSCKLGGGCSTTQLCMGGIAGCTSNCQCLGGTWQAPCPANAPQSGSACATEGAGCGYVTPAVACGGSVDCNCQGGAWSCAPTCVTLVEDAGDGSDGGTDASGPAACVAAGGHCVAGVAFCANVGPGATPKDCLNVGPGGMLCCAVNDDAGCTEIQASSYDQSCKSDSDCAMVSVGNACAECIFACGENVGAINVGALAQYMADVDKTPAGAASCGCPNFPRRPPCCRGGQCHADSECLSLDGSTDAADASAE